MADFLSAHKKNVVREFVFSKSDLKPGAIIQFNYVDKKKATSKPLVLVLNPMFQGNLHGIKLDMIPPIRLQRLVKEIDVWYSNALNAKVRQRLPLLKVNVGSPKSFYENILRPLLPAILRTIHCYREYRVNHITGLKLYEYKFQVVEDERLAEEARKQRERSLMDYAIKWVRNHLGIRKER